MKGKHYLLYAFVLLMGGFLVTSTTNAQEKKKKGKIKVYFGNSQDQNDNRGNSNDQKSDKKSKKKKKKKSAEKLMYLVLASSIFNGAGEVQAISGRDIGNVLGVSTNTVNSAINDARNAGAIYPTVYDGQYWVSVNDLGRLMNYLSEYMDDDN